MSVLSRRRQTNGSGRFSLRTAAATLWSGLVAVIILSAMPSPVQADDHANVAPIPGDTIATIQARGTLRCGSNAITGYAIPDDNGHWHGFMVDLCRAMAAAVLGDAERFEIVPVESQTRFAALQDGTVDVLVDGTTITLGRAAGRDFSFPAVWLYDGQGFLTRRSTGWKRLSDIRNASICVADGTTSRRNVEKYLAQTHLNARLVVAQSDEGAWTSYLKGRCDLFTNDRFSLMVRATLHSGAPSDHLILPDIISKEPLGPAVRAGDRQWSELIRWIVAVMISAEGHGVTSANIDNPPTPDDADVRVLTGKGEDYAAQFGLRPGWAARIIRQVGNYGEVFDRHLGKGSQLKADRGLNALWTKGGLMYAPPVH